MKVPPGGIQTKTRPEGVVTDDIGVGDAAFPDFAPVLCGFVPDADGGRFIPEEFFFGGFLFAGVTRPVPPWPSANGTPLEIIAMRAQAAKSNVRARTCGNQTELIGKRIT